MRTSWGKAKRNIESAISTSAKHSASRSCAVPGALASGLLGALHPRLAALLLGDGLASPVPNASHWEQANSVGPLHHAPEEERAGVGRVRWRGGDQVEVGGGALAEHGAVERLLVAEIMVEIPLVTLAAGRSRPPGAGEALGHELAPGGAENALADRTDSA